MEFEGNGFEWERDQGDAELLAEWERCREDRERFFGRWAVRAWEKASVFTSGSTRGRF